ncbi:MAG: BREX system Lon protease-like protein BrxL [Crenarchaeota archaeon]|jgi:ATP-dependent Lon protease|nr:BREX system Lon protease-like protein BrxL [Thermoproteota archaeon]
MEKLREVFSDMVVLKNPERTKFFSDLSLPSYMRDWLVMKFSDDVGNIDYDGVTRYIKQYIPNREDYEQFKLQMVNGDMVRFLARIRVSVDIKTGKTIFELPDFGGTKTGAGGEVSNDVIYNWQDTLLRESENWGILDLVWEQDFLKKPPRGFIKMIGYQPFCPYNIDLDYYREARRSFTTEEWLDILISAVDYNPQGYETEEQKLYFIRRLLPFVERRINLIELAPMGTGKSYVYEKISKRGWLVSSGTITRASLLYDNNKRTGGLITQFDYVAFDEIQSLKFEQPQQIQAALKSYMEFGEVKGFDTQIVADAGIIILGNIDAKKFNSAINMVDEINPVFREPAILDRFHGFIPGWEIPRFHTGIIANGWALNTEYFAEVLHELRDELKFSALVDSCLDVPPKSDQRDVTAITRLCTGFTKLLFPHAETQTDIKPEEFVKYCLEPAKSMRAIIKQQLCILAPQEFDVPGKRDIPNIQYRYS